jgi:hypothetical protein
MRFFRALYMELGSQDGMSYTSFSLDGTEHVITNDKAVKQLYAVFSVLNTCFWSFFEKKIL